MVTFSVSFIVETFSETREDVTVEYSYTEKDTGGADNSVAGISFFFDCQVSRTCPRKKEKQELLEIIYWSFAKIYRSFSSRLFCGISLRLYPLLQRKDPSECISILFADGKALSSQKSVNIC